MNKYTPDNKFIIDASGKRWPVETPHALPLPDGVEEEQDSEACECREKILFGGTAGGAYERPIWGLSSPGDTHWLARAPLPPVPKLKSQEEMDEEALGDAAALRYDGDRRPMDVGRHFWYAALAYARKTQPPS